MTTLATLSVRPVVDYSWIDVGHPVQIEFGLCGAHPMNATVVEVSRKEFIAKCKIWATDPVAKENNIAGMTFPCEFSRIAPFNPDQDDEETDEDETPAREYTPSLTETWNSFAQSDIGRYLFPPNAQQHGTARSETGTPRSMNSLSVPDFHYRGVSPSPSPFAFPLTPQIQTPHGKTIPRIPPLNGSYNVGEEVNVRVGEYWYNGEVRAITKGGNVVVNYHTNFGLESQERSFFPSAVRRVYC